MRRPERVVDVKVPECGKGFGKRRIVRLFFGMETNVLEQHDIAVAQLRDRGLGHRADAIVGERDRCSQRCRKRRRDRAQRQRGDDLSVGAPEMREHDRARALIAQVAQRVAGREDARRVADRAVLHRNVEVFADDDALATHIEAAERPKLHRSAARPWPAA